MASETHSVLQEYAVVPDTVLGFYSGQEAHEVTLKKILVQGTGNKWNSVHLVLTCGHTMYERLEQAAFFHNRPENRLETVEGGFNPDLEVNWEIALQPDNLYLMPAPGSDLKLYFRNLSKKHRLLDETLWKTISVWTEIPLSAAFGGGSIKVGYKTIFSEPTDRIEFLERQGPVSRAIVTALVEGNLPVRFDDESQDFRLRLRTGKLTFRASIKPDNQNMGLEIILAHTRSVPEYRCADAMALTERVNRNIDLGEFAITNGEFSYCLHIVISRELVTHHWVAESLMAAVSLMHHYAPEYELLLTDGTESVKADPIDRD